MAREVIEIPRFGMKQKFLALCFVRDLFFEMKDTTEPIVRQELLESMRKIASRATGLGWPQVSETMFLLSNDRDGIFGLRFYVLLVECLRDWGEKLVPKNRDGSPSEYKKSWELLKGSVPTPVGCFYYDTTLDSLHERDLLFKKAEAGGLSTSDLGKAQKEGGMKLSKADSLPDRPSSIDLKQKNSIQSLNDDEDFSEEKLARVWEQSAKLIARIEEGKKFSSDALNNLKFQLKSLDSLILERKILLSIIFKPVLISNDLEGSKSRYQDTVMRCYNQLEGLLKFPEPSLAQLKEAAVCEVELADKILSSFEEVGDSVRRVPDLIILRKILIEKKVISRERELPHPKIFSTEEDMRLYQEEENSKTQKNFRQSSDSLVPFKQKRVSEVWASEISKPLQLMKDLPQKFDSNLNFDHIMRPSSTEEKAYYPGVYPTDQENLNPNRANQTIKPSGFSRLLLLNPSRQLSSARNRSVEPVYYNSSAKNDELNNSRAKVVFKPQESLRPKLKSKAADYEYAEFSPVKKMKSTQFNVRSQTVSPRSTLAIGNSDFSAAFISRNQRYYLDEPEPKDGEAIEYCKQFDSEEGLESKNHQLREQLGLLKRNIGELSQVSFGRSQVSFGRSQESSKRSASTSLKTSQTAKSFYKKSETYEEMKREFQEEFGRLANKVSGAIEKYCSEYGNGMIV